MDKARFSRVELITIAVVTLVFAALCALGLRAYLNRDNRWVRIVSPASEKAVEIVAVTRLLQPYVRTEQGNFYRCSGSTWRDTCEVVAAERLPVNRIPGRWLTCQPEIPALPPLSGEVVDTLDVGQCQEARTYARLVILADGAIWRWQRTFSWVNGFAFASGLFLSLMLGILIGIALVRVRRYLSTPIPGTPGRNKAA